MEFDVDYKAMANRFSKAFWLGDDTWKERHANGTPVKMTDTTWFKCIHESPNIEPAYFGMGAYGRDSNVYVGFYEPTKSSPYATFCNFRYKQSWLEKKGGNDGR
jgi:hypothetical protein